MNCNIFNYFRCCINRDNDTNSILKKNYNDFNNNITGEQSPYSFDDECSITPKTKNSSSSQSFYSSDSSDNENMKPSLTYRIQSHNRYLFHPYMHNT